MPLHHVDVTGTPVTIPPGTAAAGSPLWVVIRPDLRRSAVIAGDILAALGKRRDVAGLGRNENEDIALCLAWLQAYDITHLVMTEAQRLNPLVLRKIVDFAAFAQRPLWLLHRSPRTDVFMTALKRRHAHPMRLSDVPAPRMRADVLGQRPTLQVRLPEIGFHRFLSACKHTLPHASYDKVALRHAAVARHCYDRISRDGTDIDVLARLVDEILRPAPQDDLLVTDIRALQLAAWHHDLYMKTDISQLLASPERQLTDPHTVDQALVAYRQPHRPVAVALAAHQICVTDTQALRIRDARLATAGSSASITTRGGRRIDLEQHTGRALEALVRVRTARSSNHDQPLLGVTDRAVSQALNDANTDLDIRVHGRKAERHTHPQRWLRTLGLTVSELP
ncbi:MAG: hypothetical protein ACXVXP_03155 [Mycobacteriaceae bacterium]